MASGTDRYKYQTDKGNIFYVRTDDDAELASIRGAAPTGAPTENITFQASKNSKEVGCKPRHCILSLVSTQTVQGCLVPPNQTTKRVAVLSPTHNPPAGTQITVNGRTWLVGSVIGEQMR